MLNKRSTEKNTAFYPSSLFCEYSTLEPVRIYVIYRVTQAENGIRFLVDAPQEYVNIYSTPRTHTHATADERPYARHLGAFTR